MKFPKIAAFISLLVLALAGLFVFEAPRGLRKEGLAWQADLGSSPQSILADLRALQQDQHRPLLLFFHADWCSNCAELEELLAERYTESLQEGWAVVRIDITDSARWEEPARRLFGVYGAPALSFVDRRGQVQKGLTLVGAHPPRRTLQSILDQLSAR